jgi:hypothetical protein
LPGLAIVELHRPHILVAAMHRLDLALPAQLLGHLWGRNSQHQQDDKDGDDQPDQHEPLFA